MTPANTTKPVSDFQFKEIISPAEIYVRQNAIQLDVPIWLPERRIYLYLEVNQSASAAYTFNTEVVASRQGRVLGRYPAQIADFTGLTPNQSVASLFNAGGSPVGDSLTIRLANPFNSAIPTAVIQPLRINAEIEKLTFNIMGLYGSTLTGFRAYFACLSTQY